MRASVAFVLLVAVGAAFAEITTEIRADAASGWCTAVVSDTKLKKSYRYDLSPLNHAEEMSDDLVFRNNQGYTLYMNVCGHTTIQCNPQQALCQRSPMMRLSGYGSADTEKFGPVNVTGMAIDQGITATYSKGYACDDKPSGASVHILCSASNEASISSVEQVDADGCFLSVKILARQGCGVEIPYVGPTKKGGISGAGVFLIIVFVAAALYIAVGCVVNWKVRGQTGLAGIFPNWALWSAIPGLVKDGALFIAHGFKKGDYVQV